METHETSKVEEAGAVEKGDRPVETLELGKGVRTGRWRQEGPNGNYFNKTSYKTFYDESAEDEEEAKYVNTVWFGAYQGEEVMKGIRNWNQRDGVKKSDLDQYVVPAGVKIDGYPNNTIFSIGEVAVMVIDRVNVNGKPYRRFVMSVDYQDGEGNWKKAHSFTRGQSIKLEVCMMGALEYLGTPMKVVEETQGKVEKITDSELELMEQEDDDIPF